MPGYAREATASDLSLVRVRPGFWRAFLTELERQRVDLPEGAAGEEAEREADVTFDHLLPAVIPAASVEVVMWLSTRVAIVAVVGLVGLIAGPFLARVHWLHGWSPVALLYALPAVWAILAVVSLVFPIVGYTPSRA